MAADIWNLTNRWRTQVEQTWHAPPPTSTRSTALDLVVELAATGWLAPPWTYDAAPRLRGRHGVLDYDDEAVVAAKWAWWITKVFDDPPTWRRYLANWAPPPEDWNMELSAVVPWLHADRDPSSPSG